MVVTAEAESQQRMLAGRAKAPGSCRTGLSEASVLVRKIESFGDPRLYALSVVAQNSGQQQPAAGARARLHGRGNGDERPRRRGANQGLLGMLISLLVAEKSGFQPAGDGAFAGMEELSERMTRDAMESMQNAVEAHAQSVSPAAPSRKSIESN